MPCKRFDRGCKPRPALAFVGRNKTSQAQLRVGWRFRHRHDSYADAGNAFLAVARKALFRPTIKDL